MKFLCLFLIGLIIDYGQATGLKHGKKVVCYVSTWAVYRAEAVKFTIEDIEPELCTHLVYAFAGLNDTTDGIQARDAWEDLETNYGKAGYNRMIALKRKFPHLKVLLAMGGWNDAAAKLSLLTANPERRAAFIQSVVSFFSHYKFDGLSIHWEYPTIRDGSVFDRENYVQLAKELTEAFRPHGYLLAASIAGSRSIMERAYDVAELSKYLDLVHMMCYDYHGTWEKVLGVNAPLKGLSPSDLLSVEQSIDYLLSNGVAPEKMILGIPMYGRTYILEEQTKELVFGTTPVKDVGFKGPFTTEVGFWGYNEICVEVEKTPSSWEYHWHEQSSTPYIRDGDNVISYTNGRAIALKIKLLIEKDLGGVMVWSIDTDDYKGNCDETGAYVDFQQRLKWLANEPTFPKAAKNLKLPDISQATPNGPYYVLKNNHLHLELPKPQNSDFGLTRVINNALSLSLEERKIEQEIQRLVMDNVVNVDSTAVGAVGAKKSAIRVCLNVCMRCLTYADDLY